MAASQSKGSAGKGGSDQVGSDKAVSDEAGTGKEPDGTVSADMDDLKRKFREALDRKKGRNGSANAEGAHATGKVHDAHGPASSRRSFRRKSGG
jgi:hypothetical protein